MHEMAICESILKVLEQEAVAKSYDRVRQVHLEIGRLAGVERQALEFSFDAVMRNSLADGAELKITEIDAEAWCLPCAKPVCIAARYDACPECNGYQLQLTKGDELKIKELEVD